MDFYSDSLGKTLKKIAPALPDFVKSAAAVDVEALPDSAFAWPEKRAFPIQRPEDILLSVAYFTKSAAQDKQVFPAHVKQNLAKAAFIWKIEDQFRKVAADVVASLPKPVSQEYWGLNEMYKGAQVKKYPLFDATHVKKAAAYFTENYKQYPLTWRVKIAMRIDKRAHDLNVTLPANGAVSVYTRKTPVDLEKAAAFMTVRIPYLNKIGMKKEALALAKTAKMLTEGVSDGRPNTDKMVDVLLKIDKAARLDSKYDREFPDPFMSIYNELEKSASDIAGEKEINIAGEMYKLSALGQVPLKVYGDALGGQFLLEVNPGLTAFDKSACVGDTNLNKLAEVIDTLPRDEKATLKLHLQKHANKTPKVVSREPKMVY